MEWYGALNNTMIVGADVTHPGKGPNKSAPSMAGVVATCDSHSGHYLASARLQPTNSEVNAPDSYCYLILYG
jgi:eukaryotic translation initiation factor 2C